MPGEAGIWVFVAGDLLVFSIFYLLIALGGRDEASAFAQGRATLNVWLGAVNTALLLTGSWSVAIGVNGYKYERSGKWGRFLGLGAVCGAIFVANKLAEWAALARAGITPASSQFYMYYFVFTGIHMLHALVGICVLLFLRSVTRRPDPSRHAVRTLESGAVFWHLVDVLWVFLFALFYLL